MRAQELLDRNPVAWQEAIRHPFLGGVRAGKLLEGAFGGWMIQDYLFVDDYREFVEHWTTQEFADYVSGLEEAADSSLKFADEEERQRTEAAFLDVCRLEHGFWEMAFSGGGE